ncbi:MAG: transposase [Actinomycetaceae bacterium]|nr:transposase [Actinomycetaceae bacterium]
MLKHQTNSTILQHLRKLPCHNNNPSSKQHGTKPRTVHQRVREIHERNYSVYGIGKMWHALKRGEIKVGREQTGRLMCLAGLCGKAKGKAPRLRKPKGVDKRLSLPSLLFAIKIHKVQVKPHAQYV